MGSPTWCPCTDPGILARDHLPLTRTAYWDGDPTYWLWLCPQLLCPESRALGQNSPVGWFSQKHKSLIQMGKGNLFPHLNKRAPSLLSPKPTCLKQPCIITAAFKQTTSVLHLSIFWQTTLLRRKSWPQLMVTKENITALLRQTGRVKWHLGPNDYMLKL